jgi:hypothetical protein
MPATVGVMEKKQSVCQTCGVENPSKYYMGDGWLCYPCTQDRNAQSTEDWCAATGEKIHRYSDHGYWNGERHPTCDFCGFVDQTRRL